MPMNKVNKTILQVHLKKNFLKYDKKVLKNAINPINAVLSKLKMVSFDSV